MRSLPFLTASTLALAIVSVPLVNVTPASAQGWRDRDADRDWDRRRDWGDRDRDWDRGRRWRGGGDCRVVVRRWVDDDGDEHVVRKRICD